MSMYPYYIYTYIYISYIYYIIYVYFLYKIWSRIILDNLSILYSIIEILIEQLKKREETLTLSLSFYFPLSLSFSVS